MQLGELLSGHDVWHQNENNYLFMAAGFFSAFFFADNERTLKTLVLVLCLIWVLKLTTHPFNF